MDRNRQSLRLFKPATFTYSPRIPPYTQKKDPQPAAWDDHVPLQRPSIGHKAPKKASDTPKNPWYMAATQDNQTTSIEYSPVPTPAVPQSMPQMMHTAPTPPPPGSMSRTPGIPSPVRRSSRMKRLSQLYSQTCLTFLWTSLEFYTYYSKGKATKTMEETPRKRT